ncbi:CvpA family protein [Desulfonatronospira sp.]|uniref:CvpA family protein n=1 Tax=Desulfonatronospira sp. TaxID=1962951 RepID=UPI0025BF4FD1|nr:CvpA family protein [Desulfonatronospira sp.]
MNALDIFFVIVLGFFLFRGVYRGLILEIASIAGLIAGFLAANRFYMDVYPWLYDILENQTWAQIISYLSIFLATMAVVALLAFFLRRLLRLVMLGWLDRLGGGLLGFVKAGLICSIALLLLTVFLPSEHSLIVESMIAPYLIALSDSLASYLPQDLKEGFSHKVREAADMWEHGLDKLFRNEAGQE